MFYDTHAHLDSSPFARDLAEVLARARAVGVERIVTVGTDLESSREAVRLAEQHADVFAAVGWHPNHAGEAPADVVPGIRELARHPKVVAIGEIGLDFYHRPSRSGGSREDDARLQQRQREIFEQQLALAAELGLNCVIHQRQCFPEIIEVFRPFAARVQGQFHCFVEGAADLARVLELGSIVSFTGIVTYKNPGAAREAVAAVPADRFLLETDCPYLPPVPHRGRRCEPGYVIETARIVAEVRGVSLEALGDCTCANARRFFRGLC